MQKNALRSVQSVEAILALLVGGAYPDMGTSAVDFGRDHAPQESFCKTEGCREPTYDYVTFLDIGEVDDIWDWIEHFLIPSYYVGSWENGKPMTPTESKTLQLKMRPIGPLRWVQRRAMPGTFSYLS
jgi:hypothetical protein